jgi:hypothetical protein
VCRFLPSTECGLIAAAGFEAPVEVMLQMMTPLAVALPGLHCYLGEVDGNQLPLDLVSSLITR